MTSRRRRARRREDPRRWAAVLLIICVCVIAVIVLTPGPPAADAQDGLYDFFRRAHAAGLPSFIGFGLVEWLSNVLMFLPLGFLGLLAARRRRLVVPLLVLLSGAIELIQYAFLPDRVASLKDVLANSTGALLGVLLAVAWSRRQARTQRRSDSIRASGYPPARTADRA